MESCVELADKMVSWHVYLAVSPNTEREVVAVLVGSHVGRMVGSNIEGQEPAACQTVRWAAWVVMVVVVGWFDSGRVGK